MEKVHQNTWWSMEDCHVHTVQFKYTDHVIQYFKGTIITLWW